jgi:CBS domain-containing protein/uncharacterized protein (DUF2267 family)
MSLEPYRRDRLIVQHPEVSAHDAARAMEANHIGAILVQEDGEPVGIVTDRDLALRVVGRGCDPVRTTLRAVMSTDLATLPVSSTEERAAELMRLRHVRRIPLVEADQLVGIVTLDDLLIESSVDSDRLRDLVLTQLEEPARFKPAGTTHPVKPVGSETVAARHEAARQETWGRFLHRAARITNLKARDDLEAAIEIVLGGIVRRITYQEAAHLIAQLPAELQQRLLDLPKGPDRTVNREAIELALAVRLSLGPADAMRIAREVGAVLAQAVSEGELEDVRAQLPSDMRQLLS